MFQHGRAIRGRHHVTVVSPSEASSLRGTAGSTSRITHGSVSPTPRVKPEKSVLGRRPSSRVVMVPSPIEGNQPVDTGAAAIPIDVSDEAADSQPLTLEDVRPDVPGAGQTRARPPAGVPLSKENASATKSVMGLPVHEKGGKFDTLSSNVSFSDSEEGSSEIIVCDFLEASDGSAAGGGPKSGSGNDGCRQLGGGGGVGDAARRYLNSESDDSDPSDGDIPRGLHNMGMDEQDIAFLAESRELRDAMLGVEDLHFGETKELLVGACIHAHCI